MINPDSCKRLWQLVIVMAIRDLCNAHPDKARYRSSVESWVGTYPAADFREVCVLAGLDASIVHSAFVRLCNIPPNHRLEEIRVKARLKDLNKLT